MLLVDGLVDTVVEKEDGKLFLINFNLIESAC